MLRRVACFGGWRRLHHDSATRCACRRLRNHCSSLVKLSEFDASRLAGLTPVRQRGVGLTGNIARQQWPFRQLVFHFLRLALSKNGQAQLTADFQLLKRADYGFMTVEPFAVHTGDDVSAEQKVVPGDRQLQIAALKLRLLRRAARLDGFNQKAGRKRQSQQSFQIAVNELSVEPQPRAREMAILE